MELRPADAAGRVLETAENGEFPIGPAQACTSFAAAAISSAMPRR